MPATCIHVRSHAKINFYLDVLPRRADGFHNIETIFQTVSLHDELTVRPASHLELTCSVDGLDCGESNLVMRAAHALQSATGRNAGATMHLEKRIPIAAGLAGGSGNAAAALVGLNRVWNLGLIGAQLEEIGGQIGSDVPYCLRGGTVAATGRGEIMVPLPELAHTWIVLVHPELTVSTRDVYLSPSLEKNTEPQERGRTRSFSRAIERFTAGDVASAMFNRMESVVFAMHPELSEIKRALLSCGCRAAAMSGSGPTMFGLCDSEEIARATARSLTLWRTTVVHTVPVGTELRGVDPSPVRL